MGKQKELHILIAEDDPEDFLLFELAINEICQARISHAHNGRQLMEFLQPHNVTSRLLERTTPDLIITDIKMPFAGGLDVVQHVRARSEYDKVPLVVFSTLATEEQQERAAELGATFFYRKPHTFIDLKKILGRILTNIRKPEG